MNGPKQDKEHLPPPFYAPFHASSLGDIGSVHTAKTCNSYADFEFSILLFFSTLSHIHKLLLQSLLSYSHTP